MEIPNWVWKETAEVLGVVGIIAGILFLGFELRQNNDLMAAEARRARAQSVEETWTILAENAELSAIFWNQNMLTDHEIVRLRSFYMRTLTDIELAFQELPKEDLGRMQLRYQRMFGSSEQLNILWQSQAATFLPEFVNWMEENVVNKPILNAEFNR